jgi:hypothetical protein
MIEMLQVIYNKRQVCFLVEGYIYIYLYSFELIK